MCSLRVSSIYRWPLRVLKPTYIAVPSKLIHIACLHYVIFLHESWEGIDCVPVLIVRSGNFTCEIFSTHHDIVINRRRLEKVRRHYRSGTDGRCCTGASTGTGKRFVFTHQMAALCGEKWRHGRHDESVISNRNPTSSIGAYFHEDHFCQMSPRRKEKDRTVNKLAQTQTCFGYREVSLHT